MALSAGGDLTPVEQAGLQQHLAPCPACREFMAGLRESMEQLRSVHGESLPAEHFAAVRARVMEQVHREAAGPRRRSWIYGAIAAAAALLVVTAVQFWPTQRQIPRVSRVAVTAPQALLPPANPDVAPRPRVLHRRRPSVPATVSRDAGPEMVQISTDDPNVVIYWLLEKKGE